ncbi:alpha-L-arabinofuranosidase [Microlunatus sagamiharensis]|uniref:non-reducing end alpha-L-arabinofuranosidase n=1 Tax=Microlunatus sagamiharensis TaxID=546874 RepID=A0A1H2M9U9_9ACTN|nr:alpha-L-arabinofuranosidase C-terminal domain-containing protein [Microlunatus sagamiharensis]SDU90027.1 alpha-L-arabinofuranosidase [Microlunatus sagamiharensis]
MTDPGTAAATAATVDVGLAGPGEAYSRDVFGHFVEHFHRQVYGGIFEPDSPLSDARGFRLDVVEALRELRPSVVRWPGGCFVSSYHWLDGVGPARRPAYDLAWRVTDPNTFGTAEFVDWCRAIGAEPYICTNAGTGTAEEMSDWVQYCNLPAGRGHWADLRAEHGSVEPFDVRFWSIGNENYGDWEMGAKTASEWASLVRESAKMIRHVDEDVTLLTAARADLDWTLPLLTAAGHHLDLISIHGYWDVLNLVDEPSDYLSAVGRSLGPQADIQRARDIIGAAGLGERVGRGLGIAFDEWNLRGWHHPDGNAPELIAARDRNDRNETYTMADALFSAGFLNACLRNADVVRMANIAPSVNARGPLFVHPDGVVRRTTFHVLAMYATLLGERVLASTGTGADLEGGTVPVVDHLATLHDDGRVSVALTNRHPSDAVACTLALGGHAPTGTFDATVLAGPGPDAYNDVANPSCVVPERTRVEVRDGVVHLPAHSLTALDLPLPFPHAAGEVTAPEPDRLPWRLAGRTWARRDVTPT